MAKKPKGRSTSLKDKLQNGESIVGLQGWIISEFYDRTTEDPIPVRCKIVSFEAGCNGIKIVVSIPSCPGEISINPCEFYESIETWREERKVEKRQADYNQDLQTFRYRELAAMKKRSVIALAKEVEYGVGLVRDLLEESGYPQPEDLNSLNLNKVLSDHIDEIGKLLLKRKYGITDESN